ncbi:MAG: PH domain-containing protein [Nocardioidaceae bacterium]|jgi:uncharacterized membrane protein YdbT with pleckstrin-like domain|nr:PH domain-containing protein [Nocardioidaceae bacterium]MCO5323005.1 PH domain-containing protein [Nocardioidaceae bacterium]
MALLPSSLTDPQISRHLLREEGEDIVDEVRKHWIVYIIPALVGLLALVCLIGFMLADPSWAPIPLVIGVILAVWASWRALSENIDRFVITNMRVFRVHGLFSRNLATMPLSRILDITVVKPFSGRIMGYGHFTFESAAQAQGLREIKYVGDPDRRDLAIQRVVQRAGLRGQATGQGSGTLSR